MRWARDRESLSHFHTANTSPTQGLWEEIDDAFIRMTPGDARTLAGSLRIERNFDPASLGAHISLNSTNGGPSRE
jgi:hypothetical protein